MEGVKQKREKELRNKEKNEDFHYEDSIDPVKYE